MKSIVWLVAALLVGCWALSAWGQEADQKAGAKEEKSAAKAAPPANENDGKVQYLGNWVRPEDVKRFEARQFSKYVDDDRQFTTHTVAEIERQIKRLELLNMWKPSRDQLKKMWEILNKAEPDRLMFHAKMEKSAEEIEASWIALRSEALKGVVDSFDQNPKVEKDAKSGEKIWKSIKRGVWFRLFKDYADPFLAILTPAQKSDFYGKYCNSCHSSSYMKGGFGIEIRGTQAGVDFLEKVRALTDDQFNQQQCNLAQEALKRFGKGPQTLLGKKAQAAGRRSSQDMDAEEMAVCNTFKRARLEKDKEWARTKFNYAAEIEAKNQKERLEIIKMTGKKEKGSYQTDGKTQAMVAQALFDGNLREVVGMKLGIPATQMVAKPSADVNVVQEFPDGQSACEEMCTMCHDMKRIDKAVKSSQAWRRTVVKRLHGGAVDDPKLVDMISDYLASRSTEQQKAETN